MDLNASSLVFSIPMWSCGAVFSALSCSAIGIIIIILPFIAMLWFILISEWLVWLAGPSLPQLWLMASLRLSILISLPMHLSSSIAILISPAVKQSGITGYDSMALLHWDFFVSGLLGYHDSQSLMNGCDPSSYSICMLHWCVHSGIFHACVIGLHQTYLTGEKAMMTFF